MHKKNKTGPTIAHIGLNIQPFVTQTIIVFTVCQAIMVSVAESKIAIFLFRESCKHAYESRFNKTE